MKPFPQHHSAAAMLAAAAALMIAPMPGRAAADMFIRIEGVQLSSSDPNHDTWANMLSAAARMERAIFTGQGGLRASVPSVSEIVITKTLDKSSPKLMESCCKGKHIPQVQLEFTNQNSATYARVTMTDCLVSSYSISGHGGSSDPLPMEEVSFSYSKIEFNYKEQSGLGTISATYDVPNAAAFHSTGPPSNQPPVISPVSTKVGVAGQPITFPITVTDPDSAPSSFKFAASWEPPGALSAIDFAGSGGSRTVTLQTVAGFAGGVVDFTLSVSDGEATTNLHCVAIFNPPGNQGIELSNATVPENSPAATVVGKLTTVPALPGALMEFSLADSSGGRFRIEGDQLLVHSPQFLDFETSPQCVIVVRSHDPGGLLPDRWQPFVITLQNVHEGPFDTWRAENFTPAELLDPSVSSPYSDFDGDGLTTTMEWALGLPPKAPSDPSGNVRLGIIIIDGKQYLTLTYRARPQAYDPFLSITPQVAPDGRNWLSGSEGFVEISRTPDLPMEEVAMRCKESITDRPRQLLRLQVLR